MGKEYEVVHEIFNSCSNNQMRDVFIEVEREDLEDGTVIYHLNTSGMLQRYTFTEL